MSGIGSSVSMIVPVVQVVSTGWTSSIAATSVALVALLEPGVAAVVVAVLLPEPGPVVRHQLEPGDPLGGLPEVQVRHQQPDRPAVLARQRLSARPPTPHT